MMAYEVSTFNDKSTDGLKIRSLPFPVYYDVPIHLFNPCHKWLSPSWKQHEAWSSVTKCKIWATYQSKQHRKDFTNMHPSICKRVNNVHQVAIIQLLKMFIQLSYKNTLTRNAHKLYDNYKQTPSKNTQVHNPMKWTSLDLFKLCSTFTYKRVQNISKFKIAPLE